MHHRCNSFICKCCSLGVIRDSHPTRVCAPKVFSWCCAGSTCDILCSVGKLVFAQDNASKAKGLNRRAYAELCERTPFATAAWHSARGAGPYARYGPAGQNGHVQVRMCANARADMRARLHACHHVNWPVCGLSQTGLARMRTYPDNKTQRNSGR